MTLGLATPDVDSILPNSPKAPARLTFWKVALAVFVGNTLSAAFFAVVYEAVTH